MSYIKDALKNLIDAVEKETEHTSGEKDWDIDCPICVALRQARAALDE